jgi:hypothetical protein
MRAMLQADVGNAFEPSGLWVLADCEAHALILKLLISHLFITKFA